MAYIILDIETVGLAEAAQWVEPVTAAANLKDPAKIAASIAERTEEQASKFGLDPDLCRIVSLGYHKVGYGDPVCYLFENEQEEKAGLMLFWDAYRSGVGEQENRFVTFYGHNFDLPVLMRRSFYLGVTAPKLVLRPEWKCNHIDLWEELAYGYPKKAHSLKFYQKRLGLPSLDKVDGAEIAALVQANTPEAWDAIEAHCLSDVGLTHALANRLGLLKL